MKGFTPEGRHVRVEVSKIAVGEEEDRRVVGQVRVGETEPVEREETVGMAARLKKATDSTGT